MRGLFRLMTCSCCWWVLGRQPCQKWGDESHLKNKTFSKENMYNASCSTQAVGTVYIFASVTIGLIQANSFAVNANIHNNYSVLLK